jgi:UDP-hydrolysing UDP-N-acetyl-D-glucosamine 2-epimerase
MVTKLEVIVTARPSWARVKFLVTSYAEAFDTKNVSVTLVGPAVSKRYGNVSTQIPEGVEFTIIPALQESDSLESVAQSCLNGSSALVNKWSRNRPDCVLVIADRTETLGVSVAAAIMQIPLIHLQGGEISGSIDDKIRDANSKLADFHLTTNEQTRDRLVSLGEDPARIRIVGCPSVDIVRQQLEFQGEHKNLASEEFGGVGGKFLTDDPYGLIMFHPDTFNEFENEEWVKLLIDFADSSDLNWFWFWPNPDHGSEQVSHLIRVARERNMLGNVRFVINLAPERFVELALHSKLLIGNSSFGIRESSYIGLPVINMGARQSGRQKCENVLDIPDLLTLSELKTRVLGHLSKGRYQRSTIYGAGDSGKRAAEAIGAWIPSLKSRKI